MTDIAIPDRQAQIKKARESTTGQNLSEAQIDIAFDVTSIIDRHIRKNGKFREPLTDYAHAFARAEKFDAMKGEMILRDIYTARYGRTMNATRQALQENEKNLPESANEQALQAARQTLARISTGETEPFYKSFDQEGTQLARALTITESAAKHLMSESYNAAEGRALYETGKALEERFHRPRVEALREAREEARAHVQERRPTRSRS